MTNVSSLSQHDLQQVVGGGCLPAEFPGCILYVPGYGPGKPSTLPLELYSPLV